MKLLTKIFGTQHDREMKKLRPEIDRINELEPKIEKFSNEELQRQTQIFRERLDRGESVDQLLPEAFATCREASKRIMGMRHYDVQLIGGMILNRGSIAEMRTGEGKTLMATLPVFLNALTGKGAHVVTVNDYLATRDAEWMGQLYNWMGLSVGTIVHDMSDADRKASYGADITYGTNNEFGFDYLRDNMKFDPANFVQRELNFAIVDECDSILIDEARTPLIISGPAEDSVEVYKEINKIVPHLKRDLHFIMEEKSKTVSITEEGNTAVEKFLGVENVYDIQHIGKLHYIYQALKAHYLFKKDVDYMIVEGEIVIIDEFTGRLMAGRRWSDGLHQAVEAKEGVEVRKENQTLATVTFQNYFRMYNKLSGMTGTAETEAVEFQKIYDLDVVVIPTNKPIARKDFNDIIYQTENAKFKAIAKDVKERSETGQPILIGTVSIERSEKLSALLDRAGVKHNVLNAKQHEKEAEYVAQAGAKGSITIATNMAGRGTDIMLGGNPEFLAKKETGETEGDAFDKALAKYEEICAAEKEEVKNAGGLYIIGTERHEARRVDNQLRGRSGRQGDPGESRFYLSLEDDLMRIFNGERMKSIMKTLKVDEDEPLEARMVSKAIENSQKKVEGHNFDIRKHLLDFDDVMNQQRGMVYTQRREVLQDIEVDRKVLDMMGERTSELLDMYVPDEAKKETWDLGSLHTALVKQFGFELELRDEMSSDQITDLVSKSVKMSYDDQKSSLGELFPRIQKIIFLQTIDTQWKDHLKTVDQLKEGINLRAFAQKDPLVEYKKEAFKAFEIMNQQVQEETVEKLFKVSVVAPDAVDQMQLEEEGDYDYEGSENSGSFAEDMRSDLIPGMSGNNVMESGANYRARGNDDQNLSRSQRRNMEKKSKSKGKIKI
ncbi:MAG: preprotein translocase subunit SecA [Bdellovibrionales bacterium]